MLLVLLDHIYVLMYLFYYIICDFTYTLYDENIADEIYRYSSAVKVFL